MATISSLLAERVTLRVRSVDRIFLAGSVGSLQSEGLVVRFLLDRARARGATIPSPAMLGEMGREYVAAIEHYAAANKIQLLRFEKNACKEDVAHPYLEAAEREGRHGVVVVGKAQEKAYAWNGRRDGGSNAHPHFVFERLSVFSESAQRLMHAVVGGGGEAPGGGVVEAVAFRSPSAARARVSSCRGRT